METHEHFENDKEKIIEFVKFSENPKEIEFLLVIINQVLIRRWKGLKNYENERTDKRTII